MNGKTEILKKAALFQDLNEDVISLLASKTIEKRLKRDGILFVAGEPSQGLYVIAEGSVRAFRTGADGREQVIHVERAVTTIAELPVFDEGRYPSTVAAEEDSLLLFIPKEDIRSVCITHPQLALAAAKLLAGRLRRCAELVESLSLREVGQRLAKLILEEALLRGKASGPGVTFVQKLTHNQLAARIGTVREVVTRALTRLQASGMIDVKGKTVRIPDVESLRRYVDSDTLI